MNNPTEDELIRMLIDALTEQRDDRPPGYRTREELEIELGVSSQLVLKRLNRLHRAGRLDAVIQIDVPDISGRVNPRPAYRIRQNGEL